jgi:hypothetical protein
MIINQPHLRRSQEVAQWTNVNSFNRKTREGGGLVMLAFEKRAFFSGKWVASRVLVALSY